MIIGQCSMSLNVGYIGKCMIVTNERVFDRKMSTGMVTGCYVSLLVNNWKF